MNSFEGKRIIVTGAGSGIGLELIRLLYAHSKSILAVDFLPENLKILQSEFPDLEAYLLADLSTKEGNEKILSWVLSKWETVDFCFANAGKAEYQAYDRQNWRSMDQLFQLNVFSPIQLGLELKSLFPTGKLRHVITCSAIAFWTIPGYSSYAASKSALLQWARTVWLEDTEEWLTLVFPIATSTGFFDRAGIDIPKAFPLQTPHHVAKKILSGALQGKRKIFPSPLFRIMLHLNNFLYLIRPIYQAIESKKLRSWIAKQSRT